MATEPSRSPAADHELALTTHDTLVALVEVLTRTGVVDADELSEEIAAVRTRRLGKAEPR
ncbi:MAG: hypothetical protein HZB55_23420 [Deltaproteobacteria bacterium]|nr:hypothetical protein [Deltaproteobacteria bacterium]